MLQSVHVHFRQNHSPHLAVSVWLLCVCRSCQSASWPLARPTLHCGSWRATAVSSWVCMLLAKSGTLVWTNGTRTCPWRPSDDQPQQTAVVVLLAKVVRGCAGSLCCGLHGDCVLLQQGGELLCTLKLFLCWLWL